MGTWAEFRAEAPPLSEHAANRLHGRVSYLGTNRRDGSPRVHPVTPIVADSTVYLFMEPDSPKARDLERDARYALHAGVEDSQGGTGEVLVSGRATRLYDTASRDEATQAATYTPADRYILFALDVDEVLATAYEGGQPVRTRWRSRA